MSGALFAVADALIAAGLSVIPIGSVATKAPAGSLLPVREGTSETTWDPFQQRLATQDELAAWFGPAPALAIVGGAVSGNLTILDFDTKYSGQRIFTEFCALVEEAAPGLLSRLPQIQTPSGGWHLYLRSGRAGPPEKLARGPDGKTWIETKGQGGYCLAPRSAGYRTVRGSLTQVPIISVDEWELLRTCARIVDASVQPAGPHYRTDEKPGLVFNAKSSLDDMQRWLLEAGWTVVGQRHDGTRLLRRPGKHHGISATLGQVGLRSLYVFSSNAAPFEANQGYSAFGLYAALQHHGDYAAAARQLAREYGSPRMREQRSQPAAAPPAPVQIMTVQELLAKHYPAPRYAVEKLVQDGCMLFAGRPKTGKSWLLLHIALAVPCGGYALGRLKAEKGDVLYLALEDGPRRVQARLAKLLHGTRPPEGLHIATEWPALDQGGLAAIEAWLVTHPSARLVVIDTLAKVRGRDRERESSYRQDYDAIAPLTALSHTYNVAIVVVHHTRKADAEDIMDTVSGTTGLTGAVDAMAVISRPRFGAEATLSVTGRDIEEHEMSLTWDAATAMWSYLGDARDVKEATTRDVLLNCIREAPYPLRPKEVADQTGLDYNTVKQRLWQMAQAGAIYANDGKYGIVRRAAAAAPAVQRGYDAEDHDRNRRNFVTVPEEKDGYDPVTTVTDAALPPITTVPYPVTTTVTTNAAETSDLPEENHHSGYDGYDGYDRARNRGCTACGYTRPRTITTPSGVVTTLCGRCGVPWPPGLEMPPPAVTDAWLANGEGGAF